MSGIACLTALRRILRKRRAGLGASNATGLSKGWLNAGVYALFRRAVLEKKGKTAQLTQIKEFLSRGEATVRSWFGDGRRAHQNHVTLYTRLSHCIGPGAARPAETRSLIYRLKVAWPSPDWAPASTETQ